METSPQQEEPETQHRPLTEPVAPVAPSRGPLCSEVLFASVLERMVADSAPHLFAIVAEYGDRVDAAIAAWGMAFDDRAELVATERGLRLTMPTPYEALAVFSLGSHIRTRVVWFDPESRTPAEGEPDPLTHAEFEG